MSPNFGMEANGIKVIGSSEIVSEKDIEDPKSQNISGMISSGGVQSDGLENQSGGVFISPDGLSVSKDHGVGDPVEHGSTDAATLPARGNESPDTDESIPPTKIGKRQCCYGLGIMSSKVFGCHIWMKPNNLAGLAAGDKMPCLSLHLGYDVPLYFPDDAVSLCPMWSDVPPSQPPQLPSVPRTKLSLLPVVWLQLRSGLPDGSECHSETHHRSGAGRSIGMSTGSILPNGCI